MLIPSFDFGVKRFVTFPDFKCRRSVLVHVLWWRAGINSLCHTSVLVWLARVWRERERGSQMGVTAHPRMQNQPSLMCVLVRNTPESHQHFRPSSCVRGTHISAQAWAFVLLTKRRYLVVLSIREEELTGFITKVSEWEVEENRRMGWRCSESTTRFSHFLPHRLQRSEENLSQIKPLPLRAKAEPQEKRERVRQRVEKLPKAKTTSQDRLM